MKSRLLMTLACATLALPALADEVTYRKDIRPLIKEQCSECHGNDSPTLAEFLLEQGYDVIGMVRRSSTERFERINHLRDRLTLHQADLLDQLSIITLLQDVRPQEVYNLAAQSHVAVSSGTGRRRGIQSLADLPQQILLCEGLLDEDCTGIQNTVVHDRVVGVTRREQHRQVGPHCFEPSCQLAAARVHGKAACGPGARERRPSCRGKGDAGLLLLVPDAASGPRRQCRPGMVVGGPVGGAPHGSLVGQGRA